MTATDSAPTVRDAVASHRFAMRIGGEAVALGRRQLVSVDPTTERQLAEFPEATPADVDHAVQAAGAAASEWGRQPWTSRAAALHELATAIDGNAEELALLDTLDGGMPIRTARKDVADSARALRYFAGLGGGIEGRSLPWSGEGPQLRTMREPYGIVGKIVPFNHPLKFAVVKVAAPLIAGNSVILKPSEFTSLSALRLGELAAGCLPAGVLNVLAGGGEVGAAMVAHPGIPRLAFTGSVATGQAVLRAAAENIKHVTVELGGKNPMIVFGDVDPRTAAQAAVANMDLRRTPGQACWSTSRVFVHASIRKPFLDALVEAVAEVRVGDPTDPDVDMGPLAYEGHHRRVTELVAAGRAEGATLLCGGDRPAHLPTGYFLQPTVFTDVEHGMRIATQEIFGPVISVLTWRDTEEVLRQANDTTYGLTASVWSADAAQADEAARRLEAGMVWVNSAATRPLGMPFGGYKRSGLGKEGSFEDVVSYTREKSIISTALPAVQRHD